MTEAEWLNCGDHAAMLAWLDANGKVGVRKCRLLIVAYCRTFLPGLLAREPTRSVIEAAEAYSDGAITKGELARAKRVALKAVERQPRLDLAVRGLTHGLPRRQAVEFPYFCVRPWKTSNYNRPTPVQQRRLGQTVREIYGNPFRPLAFNSTCLTPTVLSLARAIYDERAFDRLPIIADALEEAGCHDAEILAHCRGPGPHARGCFVIDSILGKE